METPSVKRRSKETSKVFMTTELLSFILSTTHSVSSGREKKNPRKKQVHTLRKFLLGYFFFLTIFGTSYQEYWVYIQRKEHFSVFSRFTVETSCLQSVTLSTSPALFQVRYFLYQASSTMLKSTQQCVYISCLERNERKWLVFKQFYNGALLILEI